MSGGWIKWEKDLGEDPRVLRMARELKRMCNADAFNPVTLVCGGLIRMWGYADSHIREDNTLDLGASQLDEVIGIAGFCGLLPECWFRVIDENTVELPDFQQHNGVEARKRALTQKRVTRHRGKVKRTSVTKTLPDQDQDQDQDHKEGAKAPSLPAGLDSKSWDRWLTYRTEIRKPLKPASIPAAQKTLAAFGSDQAAVVEQSIAQGWQGLFPLKKKPNGGASEWT